MPSTASSWGREWGRRRSTCLAPWSCGHADGHVDNMVMVREHLAQCCVMRPPHHHAALLLPVRPPPPPPCPCNTTRTCAQVCRCGDLCYAPQYTCCPTCAILGESPWGSKREAEAEEVRAFAAQMCPSDAVMATRSSWTGSCGLKLGAAAAVSCKDPLINWRRWADGQERSGTLHCHTAV